MEARPAYVPKLETGIPLIDQSWGGFYEGGSYLCYGAANSGRGLLGLMFTHQGVLSNQACLYVTPTRSRALVIQSEAIGFDLRSSYETGAVRLMRIPPTLARGRLTDAQLGEALHDLAALVRTHRPRRVVIDDFRLFTQFSTFEHFASAFTHLLDTLDPLNTTLLVMMGEPTSEAAQRVLAFMREQLTGTIHLEVQPLEPVDLPRRLSLLPGIGHMDSHADDFDNLAALAHTHVHRSEPAHAISPPSPSRRAPAPDGAVRPARSTTGASARVEPRAPRTGDGASIHTTDAAMPASPRPSGTDEASPAETPVTTTAIQTERQAFALHLQQHFMRRDLGHGRFLLIALRMTGDDDPLERGLYFESIDRHVRQTLQAGDICFTEPAAERIVVLIPEGTPPDDQRFFARLQKHLKAEAPAQATYLMNTVSAIVLPNGQPFKTAEAFMAYAVDAT